MSKLMTAILAEVAKGRLVEFGLDQNGGGVAIRVRESVHVRETRITASQAGAEDSDDLIASELAALAKEHDAPPAPLEEAENEKPSATGDAAGGDSLDDSTSAPQHGQ